MKITLVAINAKYIHFNPAIESLARYAADEHGIACQRREFTINQTDEFILSELFRDAPDLLGFSCYIWNIRMIRGFIPTLRKILPQTKILLGGPEVSYGAPQLLDELGVDYILYGEGEIAFSQLCLALMQGTALEDVPSLCWRTPTNEVRQNPQAPPLALEKLPFLYEDTGELQNRIIYYEAQRGCPFHCQYCLSSLGGSVRFQPLDKVCLELHTLLNQNVRQVKFVDRTFNANADFAMKIWKFLAENDNGTTNFHFELDASLLTESMIDFLETVRPGLFQFEIGIQSTCPETLRAIQRDNHWEKILPAVERLHKAGNIHLHLDLIAGLPLEGYNRFGESFDTVYSLTPNQFQLGFLKLLHGAGLRQHAADYGIVYREEAPYEVLYTDALSYAELLRLKDIEALVDSYYNSGRFETSLAYLVHQFPRPFVCYEAFADHYRKNGEHLIAHSVIGQCNVLYRFGLSAGCDAEALRWRIKFDLCRHEKPRKLPDWLDDSITVSLRNAIFDFYENPQNIVNFLPQYRGLEYKQIYKMAHIELFPFDPLTGEAHPQAYLFNYRQLDLTGNAACTPIALQSAAIL